MKRHFLDNGIDLSSIELVEAAVAPEDGSVWFHTGDSGNWYRQKIAGGPPAEGSGWVGSKLAWRNKGRSISSVPAVALDSLLRELEIVDLIDPDIQGSEADVFDAARGALARLVRRVHIRTHSVENEERLRDTFGELGWESLYDFPGDQHNLTPYGRMLFQDGVQSWVNPRLA